MKVRLYIYEKLRELIVFRSSIPVRFGIVRGDFDCSSNRLLNLEGCPVAVGGNYNCSSNKLFSLKVVLLV